MENNNKERYETLLRLLVAVHSKLPVALRGQERIMEILYSEGPLSVKGVITIMGIKSGSVSEIINRLEDLGYVSKQPGTKDKRERIISLTESGKTHVEDSRAKIQTSNNITNPVYALNLDEVETMISLFEKMLH